MRRSFPHSYRHFTPLVSFRSPSQEVEEAAAKVDQMPPLITSTCRSIASTKPTRCLAGAIATMPWPHRRPESHPCDMVDWTQCQALERDPAKVSGSWVFGGTRVPVKALFENVGDGARVDDFLASFSGVTRQQVEAVLQHAELSLAEA